MSPEVAGKKRRRAPVENEPLAADDVLARLFVALIRVVRFRQATGAAGGSECTFATMQKAVQESARHVFTLHHLAQMVTVWPEALVIEPCMALHEGRRVGSLEIRVSQSVSADADLHAGFQSRLCAIKGDMVVPAELPCAPSVGTHPLLPRNASKKAAIADLRRQRPAAGENGAAAAPAGPVPLRRDQVQNRQAEMMQRIRAKQAAAPMQEKEPDAQQRQEQRLRAKIPQCLQMLHQFATARASVAHRPDLASSFSVSTRELASHLVSSLRQMRDGSIISDLEATRLLDILAPSTHGWMTPVRVGAVDGYRFEPRLARLRK